MGKYFSKMEDSEPLTIGIDEDIYTWPQNRIEESKKTVNGVLCTGCGAALKPSFEKKVKIPFYCKRCFKKIYSIKGTYGILSLINEEDKWLSSEELFY